MVVAIVLAILMSFGVSSYRQFIQRANRVDGSGALLRLAVAEERFYLQNARYGTTPEELAAPPPLGLGQGPVSGLGRGNSERGLYHLTVAPSTGGPTVGYTLTATVSAQGSQRDDLDCYSLSIDQSGRRGARNQAGAENSTLIASCWK